MVQIRGQIRRNIEAFSQNGRQQENKLHSPTNSTSSLLLLTREYGDFWLSISHKTIPKEYTSAFRLYFSGGVTRTSGAMYLGLPGWADEEKLRRNIENNIPLRNYYAQEKAKYRHSAGPVFSSVVIPPPFSPARDMTK